jgi:hypothetical protein
MSTNPSHDWATRRLLAYSVGLMPEDELLRLEEHLAGCPECRARLAPLKAAAGAGAGHLPSSLIATWPRSSRLLEGLERELVEAHLEDCEECRAALAFAGTSRWWRRPCRGRGPSRRAVRVVRPLRRGGTFWAWASGLPGAAAGLLAWAAATHPGGSRRGPQTSARWVARRTRGRRVRVRARLAHDRVRCDCRSPASAPARRSRSTWARSRTSRAWC